MGLMRGCFERNKDLFKPKDLASVRLIVEKLKECYKNQSTLLRLLDKPLPINTIYTELASFVIAKNPKKPLKNIGSIAGKISIRQKNRFN